MLKLIAVLFVTFVVLMFAEWLSRAKKIHSELTRKFIHIVVGTIVAFWPFFLSWGQIQLLSAAFIIVILFSTRYNVFHSIHGTKRDAYSEVVFALAIGILSFIVTSKWIFAASMMALSLGDGLAAVVGTLFGDTNRYKVFGRRKSIAGTATFAVACYVIMAFYTTFSHGHVSSIMFVLLPLMATAAENIAHGFDNIVVPMLFALVLSSSL